MGKYAFIIMTIVIIATILFIHALSICFSFLFTGGIFPEELKSSPVEVAFKYAVFSVNRERKLLGNNTTLVYRTLYYKNNDIFQASKIGKFK